MERDPIAENLSINPERAELLRGKALLTLKGIVEGDPDAMKNWGKINLILDLDKPECR